MTKTFTKSDTNIAKGMATLLLLLYHLFHDARLLEELKVNYAPIPQEIFLTVSSFGNICVAIFVMITAYGITKSILSVPDINANEAYKQAGKRFWKLLGGFALLYFSVILVWCYRFDLASLYGEGKQGILLLLCDATGLATYLGTPNLNETWWYMPLAYALIFLIPFLAFCYKKIGNTLLLAGFFVPMVLTLHSDMQRYFFVAVMGVCAAGGDWFNKLLSHKIHAVLKWLVGILGFVLCILIRENAVVKDYFFDYVDAPVAFFIICFAVMLLGTVPGIKQFLSFVGKHSMYIFLVHTFFYMILFRGFIYQFEYAGITFALLLATSLVYAVILDYVRIALDKIVRKIKKS